MNDKLILASKSPRRKQLLELAEIDFDIITKDTDESYPLDLPVEKIPEFIALKKAKEIQFDFPHRKILAADTIVVLDNEVIGKPKNREEAFEILSKLSGKTHRVTTGVVILNKQHILQFSDHTEVSFHSLTARDINYYIDTYKPFDKAGAYAIQEWIGAIAIKKIEGCFYNVMGLPISKVVRYLNEG